MTSAIGLSDRLRDRGRTFACVQPTHYHSPDYSKGRALLEEAATQLDVLQARVKELEAEQAAIVRDYQRMNSQLADEMKHATRAEQERDEAYERAAKDVDALALHAQRTFDAFSHGRPGPCITAEAYKFAAKSIRQLKIASGPDKEK